MQTCYRLKKSWTFTSRVFSTTFWQKSRFFCNTSTKFEVFCDLLTKFEVFCGLLTKFAFLPRSFEEISGFFAIRWQKLHFSSVLFDKIVIFSHDPMMKFVFLRTFEEIRIFLTSSYGIHVFLSDCLTKYMFSVIPWRSMCSFRDPFTIMNFPVTVWENSRFSAPFDVISVFFSIFVRNPRLFDEHCAFPQSFGQILVFLRFFDKNCVLRDPFMYFGNKWLLDSLNIRIHRSSSFNFRHVNIVWKFLTLHNFLI